MSRWLRTSRCQQKHNKASRDGPVRSSPLPPQELNKQVAKADGHLHMFPCFSTCTSLALLRMIEIFWEIGATSRINNFRRAPSTQGPSQSCIAVVFGMSFQERIYGICRESMGV